MQKILNWIAHLPPIQYYSSNPEKVKKLLLQYISETDSRENIEELQDQDFSSFQIYPMYDDIVYLEFYDQDLAYTTQEQLDEIIPNLMKLGQFTDINGYPL